MASMAPRTQWRNLNLLAGEQAVVNGALVTSSSPVFLQIGSGANILRERPAKPARPDFAPARELYYRTLLIGTTGLPTRAHREKLYALLGMCVLHYRTREAQTQCSTFAAAIASGNYDGALKAAYALSVAESIVADEPSPSAQEIPIIPIRNLT